MANSFQNWGPQPFCGLRAHKLGEECRLNVFEKRVLKRIFGLNEADVTRG